MAEQRIVIVDGTSRRPGYGMGVGLLRQEGVTVRHVSKRDLGDPQWNDIDGIYRAVHTYARAQGFVGGYPTFLSARSEYDPKHTVVLLDDSIAEYRMLKMPELNRYTNWAASGVVERLHAVRWIARDLGAAMGFPTGERTGDGDGAEAGAVVVKPCLCQLTFVPLTELGAAGPNDVHGILSGAQTYATSKGFTAGLSDFQADYWHNESELAHKVQEALNSAGEGWRVVNVQPLSSGPVTDGEGRAQVYTSLAVTLQHD